MFSSEILFKSKFVAAFPISKPDWFIVVKAGSITDEIDSLLKPTIAISSGILTPTSFKYLMAYGGIDLPQATSTITTGVDGRYVNMDLNYEINLPNFDSDEGLPGKGIAFDLGATVNVGESMQVSASVLDIGSINYSKNTTSYQFTGDMNFEGIEMDNLFENNSLKIGKWKTDKCHLVLFNLTHVNTALVQHKAKEVHGIIGADILQKGKAFIDYNKNVLYLKKTKK